MVGIGKPWGVAPHAPPSERAAIALLEFAYDLGIRYFDTAPSYGDGVSEERPGRFLRGSPRDGIAVANQFGEHWDAGTGAPYADHSSDALRPSLDRSCRRLGRIDILHLHKTTPQSLASSGVARIGAARHRGSAVQGDTTAVQRAVSGDGAGDRRRRRARRLGSGESSLCDGGDGGDRHAAFSSRF